MIDTDWIHCVHNGTRKFQATQQIIPLYKHINGLLKICKQKHKATDNEMKTVD